MDTAFRLESNSANEIYLEVATDSLARALKSAAVSSSLRFQGGDLQKGLANGVHD